jgi:hypothetical protein
MEVFDLEEDLAHLATLTPALSLSEGEGACRSHVGTLAPGRGRGSQFELSGSAARRGLSRSGGAQEPSPPERERVAVRAERLSREARAE